MTDSGRTRGIPGFPHLWLAQTVSLFGNQVSLLAIPTLAIFGLQASDTEVGVLRGLEWVFFPLLALWFGALADRTDVRGPLVLADGIRFVALVTLVVCASTGMLSMSVMFVTAAVIGVGSVMFNVAFMTQIPRMVPAHLLGRANARIAIPQSVAEVSGPGIAALLIQTVGAVASIIVDAATYLVSAILILRLPRPAPIPTPQRRSILRDMGEGVHLIRRSAVLQSLCLTASAGNLAFGAASTVLILFAYRQLDLTPGYYGVALSLGSVGAIIASLLAPRVHHLLGFARSMTLGMALFAAAVLCLPLAALTDSRLAATAILTAGWFGLSFGTPVFDIAQVTIRQSITPIRLQGRMNAAVRTLVFGALPLGAFLGGWAGDLLGYIPVLLGAGLVSVLGTVATLARATRSLGNQNDLEDAARSLEAELRYHRPTSKEWDT